jgi:hypothetical protein
MELLPPTVTLTSADLAQALNSTTIKIRYSRPVRLRFWLAARLCRIAGWLAFIRVDGDR